MSTPGGNAFERRRIERRVSQRGSVMSTLRGLDRRAEAAVDVCKECP